MSIDERHKPEARRSLHKKWKAEAQRFLPKNPSDFGRLPAVIPTLIFFSVLILLTPTASHAQVGTCEEPMAVDTLDVGNVRAAMYNSGTLFWRGGQNLYEVPKGSGIQSVFTSSFIAGGFIDNQLRTTASSYGPYEFWAGPLDAQGNPPANCSVYDQIGKISKQDFILFDEQDIISNNLLTWPWWLGAPVIDGDGDPNNYNLRGGDRPELLGDQTLWWVMNDRGNEHVNTKTPPIGLEVHVNAFAFEDPDIGGDITFYRYRIINRNTVALRRAFVGMWVDPDLGDFTDDYVGSDSLLHLAYTYNGDPLDEGNYEKRPPAIGYTFLKTPVADIDAFDNDRDGQIDEPGEPAGMHAMVAHFGGGGFQGDPQYGADYYGYMRGKWLDGISITEGGNGRNFSQQPTRFMYSGDPVSGSYWSEFQLFPDSDDISSSGDRRFMASSGPFTLQPDESTEFVLAIVWARGDDNLSSIRKLKKITSDLQTAPDSLLFSGYQRERPTSPPPDPEQVLGFDQNFPNPFTGTTTFRYSLPKTMHVRLAVYDVLGREVAVLTESSQEAGIHAIRFDGTNLPPGTYFARIELDHLRFTKLMVRVR